MTVSIGLANDEKLDEALEAKSRNPDRNGKKKPVTTISTICIKSGDFIRINLAVLRSYDLPMLFIDEMKPSLLDVGSDLAEAQKLSTLHCDLQNKLISKQTNIEEMLSKADKLVSEQPENQALVYEAMAESLGATWRDLNVQLKLRDALLQCAVNFFTFAQKHRDQLDQMENFMDNLRNPVESCNMVTVTLRRKELKRNLLDTALEAMTYGDKSISLIREIGSKSDNLERGQEVVETCTKIETIMLTLYDRDKQLDAAWEQKQQINAEFSKQASQICSDLQKIEEWVRRRVEALKRQDLGDSEQSTETLLQEHEVILQECKEMIIISNQLSPLNDELQKAGYNDGGDLKGRCGQVKKQLDDLLVMLENRRQLLQMALSFFKAAYAASQRLDTLASEIKTFSLSREKRKILQQYADLSSKIEESALPAINLGRQLLEKIGGRGSAGGRGVEVTLTDLERKYEALMSMCSTTKQDAMLKSQGLQNLLEKYQALSSWLTNVGEAALFTIRDLGTTLPTSGDFLERHRLLEGDFQIKRQEYKDFLRTFEAIEIDPSDPEYQDIKSKVGELRQRWEKFERFLQNRLNLGQIYQEFHANAAKLGSDFDSAEAIAKTCQSDDSLVLSRFESLWAQISNDYQKLRSLGDQFLEKCRHCVEDTNLNLTGAQRCVESILNQLGSRQISLGRIWAEQQAKLKHDKEFRQFWHTFSVDCNRATECILDLRNEFCSPFHHFEERPPSNVASRLQHSLDPFRLKVKKHEHQLETLLKSAETSSVPNSQWPEKNKLVESLLEAHRNVQHTAAEFEVLISMNITFFQNLQKIDDWIQKIEDKFNAQNLTRCLQDGKIEQLIQEHKAACQTLEEFFQFARSETNQILNRVRQPDIATSVRNECEKLPGLVDERITSWSLLNNQLNSTLQQFSTINKFEFEITEIVETIESLTKHVREMTQNLGLSKQATEAADQQFRSMERNVQVTDQRVSNVLSTADSYLSGPYRGNQSLQRSRETLYEKWQLFRQALDEFRCKFEAAKNYWTLHEESESWIKETTEYVVETGRKANQLKSSQQAEHLQKQLDSYVQPKKSEQEKRLEKIETVAKVLYGQEAEHKIERHKRRYKEIVDTIHEVGIQIQNIRQTFLTTEETLYKQTTEIAAQPQTQAPRFVQPLKDGQVTEGSRFEFICQVEAYPNPEVQWFKDGISISHNPDYHTSFVNGVCTLKIDETMIDDSSNYSCRASNVGGLAETKANLIVKESPFLHMKPPEFVKRLQPGSIDESASHVFECTVTGHPAPVISWYRNDQCVDRTAGYQPSSSEGGVCRLRVEQASQVDNAVFKCRAVNPAGEASTSASLDVIIKHQPPRIVQPLNSVVVVEGSRVLFEARVSGDPQPDVTWYKNGAPLMPSAHLQILKDSYGCHRLVIDHAEMQDAAEFSIRATNLAGEAKSSAVLQVQPKPAPKVQHQIVTEEFFECQTDSSNLAQSGGSATRFSPVTADFAQKRLDTEEFKTYNQHIVEDNSIAPHFEKTIVSAVVDEGCSITFAGFITGSPLPVVTWSRDGRELSPREYQQSFQNGHVTLTILKAAVTDAGKYVCSAKNDAGLATSSAQLVVTVPKEPPDFVERLVSQEVEEGTPLRWQVKLVGDPAPVVTWLKNGVPFEATGRIQMVNLGHNSHALYIPQCQMGDAGQITCKAENEAGEARSTADLVIRRQGDVPKSYYHVTRVFQQEHGKETSANRYRQGPIPFANK